MLHASKYDLTDLQQRALEQAEKILKKSDGSPLKLQTGAALYYEGDTADDDTIVGGKIVDNFSYGQKICSEQSAILQASAIELWRFAGIAVIARQTDSEASEFISPCGSCLQSLHELAQHSDNEEAFELILATTRHDKVVIVTIKELLPLGCGHLNISLDAEEFQM